MSENCYITGGCNRRLSKDSHISGKNGRLNIVDHHFSGQIVHRKTKVNIVCPKIIGRVHIIDKLL